MGNWMKESQVFCEKEREREKKKKQIIKENQNQCEQTHLTRLQKKTEVDKIQKFDREEE